MKKVDVSNQPQLFSGARELVDCFLEEEAGSSGGSRERGVYPLREFPAERARGKKIVLLGEDTPEKRERIARVTGDGQAFLSKLEWCIRLLEDPRVRISPQQVRLDICTLCQLDCVSCYMRRDERQTTGLGYVQPEQFEDFLRREPQIHSLEISNSGEPFLHPRLHEIMEIAHRHGVTLTCYNGTNFNHVADQVLEDMVRWEMPEVTVALDGASQETYAVYRRNGQFDRVIENIRKLNAIKKAAHSALPRLTWQFVVMSHNYDDIPRAEEMAKELEMDIAFHDTWSAPERKKLRRMLEERGVSAKAADAEVAEHKNDFDAYCMELLTHPQINWDGRLLGCCQIYRSDWGMNAFETSLTEIMNSPVYRETVLALLKGEALPYDGVPCFTCRRQPLSPGRREAMVGLL